jgi:hypothetical protein
MARVKILSLQSNVNIKYRSSAAVPCFMHGSDLNSSPQLSKLDNTLGEKKCERLRHFVADNPLTLSPSALQRVQPLPQHRTCLRMVLRKRP